MIMENFRFIFIIFDVDGIFICVIGLRVNYFYKCVFVYFFFEVFGINGNCDVFLVGIFLFLFNVFGFRI